MEKVSNLFHFIGIATKN